MSDYHLSLGRNEQGHVVHEAYLVGVTSRGYLCDRISQIPVAIGDITSSGFDTSMSVTIRSMKATHRSQPLSYEELDEARELLVSRFPHVRFTQASASTPLYARTLASLRLL